MKKASYLVSAFIAVTLIACTTAQIKTFTDTVNTTNGTSNKMSNEEVIQGLKEALSVGTNNSAGMASKVDGFLKNDLIKIPFPQEAVKVYDAAVKWGFKDKADKFVETMNHGAEEAAKSAAPIFLNAIKGMSIGDGFAILKGGDGAATKYLSDKTGAELHTTFKPKVQEALKKVALTNYWNPVITAYNKVPGHEPQNPDLDEYVTGRAKDGLLKLIAIEENKIRKDPVARVSDILKKVFGSAY